MNILIVGENAGAHALAWKFAESRRTGELYCTSPYSGIDTLCTRIEEPPDIWSGSHRVDLVVGQEDAPLYIVSDSCLQKAIHITVDCLTDGHTIVPMPAVLLHRNETGEITAAETPASAYTAELAHYAYHQFFIPHIRIHGHARRGIAGIVRFELELWEGKTELLSVERGFGELDALALLPLLRGELAGLLKACENETLTREMLRLNGFHSAVCMLGASRSGVPICGLGDVPSDTGVFLGTVQYRDGTLYTAGPRPLFVCGRGQDTPSARHAARVGAEKIRFEGVQRYYFT